MTLQGQDEACMSVTKPPLAACVALILAAPLALAVDTPTSTAAPDLTAVRAKIKTKDFNSALADLSGMIERGVQHAGVYNLLGFSLRKTGDYAKALTFYRKALD